MEQGMIDHFGEFPDIHGKKCMQFHRSAQGKIGEADPSLISMSPVNVSDPESDAESIS
jgi:hypothetical protein